MGALNQLGQAATSFVQNPVGSVSDALAKADKDLGLSANAPLIAAGTGAYFAAPYIASMFGGGAAGAAGAGAATGAFDAGIGLNAMTGGAGTAAGGAGLLASALNWAKTNPELALAGAGLATKSLTGSSTPSS